jgi:hypothetical protein
MHTSGPWRIGDAGRTVFGPRTAEPAPVTIASLPAATPRVGREERIANASLIVAAPTMYEVLQHVAAFFEGTDAGLGQAARDALALADGTL